MKSVTLVVGGWIGDGPCLSQLHISDPYQREVKVFRSTNSKIKSSCYIFISLLDSAAGSIPRETGGERERSSKVDCRKALKRVNMQIFQLNIPPSENTLSMFPFSKISVS